MKRNGFTLTEALVTLSILAAIALLLVPTYGKVRLSGASAQCVHHLRLLVSAHIQYRSENRGFNPPYVARKFEGHDDFGIILLRQYYMPGPPYSWDGDRILPTPEAEKCPVVKLRPDLALKPKRTSYALIPHHATVNLNQIPDASKIPVLYDAWSAAWLDTVPLRHHGFQGIQAAFLDGHVEPLLQNPRDGRLHWTWWYATLRELKPRNTNLGKGREVGSLEAP